MKNVNPPVKVGDEVRVVVESIGSKGDGIVKVKGFVVFVPSVKEREKVKIKISKVHDKVGFGEVVERLGEGVIEKENTSIVPPPELPPAPEDSENFGEELDSENELDEFEALVKE